MLYLICCFISYFFKVFSCILLINIANNKKLTIKKSTIKKLTIKNYQKNKANKNKQIK